MMRVDVVTVLPDFFTSVLENGIIKIATTKNLLDVRVHSLYKHGLGTYAKVDDTPYGGGAGMILKPEPLFSCVESLQAERSYDEVVLVTPSGETFSQQMANSMSKKKSFIFLCGHYKGIDERVREGVVTKEISMGDYVLSGGELPVLCILDAVVRLMPGVLTHAESAWTDSFQNKILDSVYYTRPAVYRDMEVPDVLRNGNHKAIEAWRQKNAKERTRQKRPDLLDLKSD